MDENSKKEKFVDVTIEAFTALRNEIGYRTQLQTQIIALCVSAVGVLAGYFLSGEPGNPEVLFLIPIITSVLGIVWVDHHVAIKHIGGFVQTSLQRDLGTNIGVPQTAQYVKNVDMLNKIEYSNKLRFILVSGPPLFIFVVLPVLSVGFANFALVLKACYSKLHFLFTFIDFLFIAAVWYVLHKARRAPEDFWT